MPLPQPPAHTGPDDDPRRPFWLARASTRINDLDAVIALLDGTINLLGKADALAERDGPGDREKARALVERAVHRLSSDLPLSAEQRRDIDGLRQTAAALMQRLA